MIHSVGIENIFAFAVCDNTTMCTCTKATILIQNIACTELELIYKFTRNVKHECFSCLSKHLASQLSYAQNGGGRSLPYGSQPTL